MARIRTIKPEFFKHEGLYDLEKATGLPVRLVYPGLWCQADKAGRFKWQPRTLKSEIMPHDEIDFLAVLKALADGGFIIRYSVNGVEYAYIPAWSEHQRPNNKEHETNIPAPPIVTEKRKAKGCLSKPWTEPRDSCQTPSNACVTPRDALVEGEGEGEGEGKGNGTPLPPKGGVSEAFEEFWKSYPKKVGKKAAQSAWNKVRPSAELAAAMLAAVEKQKTWPKWSEDGGRYIPNPATWLNQGRWEDERVSTGHDPATRNIPSAEATRQANRVRIDSVQQAPTAEQIENLRKLRAVL